jgi:aldehyde dehydrogenase (NAD+)
MANSFSVDDFKQMQAYFFSGATRSYAFRKQQLIDLKKAVQRYEKDIFDALWKDLHKPAEEVYALEMGSVIMEVNHSLRHLKGWMRKEKVWSPMAIFPSTSYITREPLGITLVIAPWNYPFQLLFNPLIAAIAAGNCVVLKPSEFTPAIAAVMDKIITELFPPEYVRLIEGDGAIVVPAIMKENRFDHVFFTGSIPVGREIMKLAADQLVPVTLELGGKSPCIIDKNVNIDIAARRIAWGKFINAGQTCVAPDYLLVHESRKDQLLQKIQLFTEQFFTNTPAQSPDYCRIVSQRRFDKLQSFLKDGRIIFGGDATKEDLFIAPTLLDQVAANAPVMQEEIFGPILPVFTYRQPEEALALIQQHPRPLALYVFSNDVATEKYFINNIQFGGGCINNTIMHLGNADIPFGGVGNSGIGHYHGKYGFDTFSHAKSIVKTARWFDAWFKYPPYKGKMKWLKTFIR